MPPPPQAADLVHRWLDRLQALDLEGLVDMYDPQAEMQTLHETWKGRDEIQDGLAFAKRWLRGIQVDVVDGVEGDAGAMTFDTTVRGKLGRARVRHTWTLDNGRIRGHALSLLRHDKQVAG